ncbi:MAG: ATP-binding cassette domain-containing protein [Candidatus Hydrothermarchaeota archaeon]|nr:ATP-binding cassette domain-containing protein [Candidatus Hydrothermarchaeota archaeon]
MIIEMKALTKVYEDKIRAVDSVSLEIEEGEVFGLLGPNGAGKTTLIHMLATLIKPTRGTAIVNGYDIIKEEALVRQSIGIVFQDPSSDDMLTGYENLKLHALMYGVPRGEREEKISQLLELAGLKERANDRVRHYSGGMRRRLELARGLLHSPKVLFLDEPTLGLDPQSRERMWSYIEGLIRNEERSILITTHYMEEAERLCNRVAIIDQGKIAVLDTPDNLKSAIGGEVIKLKIKEPRLENLNLSYIKKLERRGDYLYLTVKDASRHLQEILKFVGEVESVEMRTPTLNDVFLHYTGKEIREGASEGGYMEKIIQARFKR